jgi:hypothetical protein
MRQRTDASAGRARFSARAKSSEHILYCNIHIDYWRGGARFTAPPIGILANDARPSTCQAASDRNEARGHLLS